MSEASTPKTWWEAWSSHVVWGALVFTCFLVFIEKLIEQHFGQALSAFLLGLGIVAVALHSKTWLERTNPNWVYAGAFAAVLALILSPLVEEKRWPLSAWFQSSGAPSADQIAAAVVKILPKQSAASSPSSVGVIEKATAPILDELSREQANLAEVQKERNKLREQLAAIPKPPAFVNPFHEPPAKWQVAELLRHQLKNEIGLSTDCRIIIVQTPTSYAEDFAADFKRILDVVDWKYESRLATAPVDKGISVRANNDDAKSTQCANALANGIRSHVRNDPHRWFGRTDVPENLRARPSGCIEIGFGIEEPQ